MCVASPPSLVAVRGSAFSRIRLCILSMSVPWASLTRASVRPMGLTFTPSRSRGMMMPLSHAPASLSWRCPRVQCLIHCVSASVPPGLRAMALMWLSRRPLGPGAAPACRSRTRRLTDPSVILGTLCRMASAHCLASSRAWVWSWSTGCATNSRTLAVVSSEGCATPRPFSACTAPRRCPCCARVVAACSSRMRLACSPPGSHSGAGPRGGGYSFMWLSSRRFHSPCSASWSRRRSV